MVVAFVCFFILLEAAAAIRTYSNNDVCQCHLACSIITFSSNISDIGMVLVMQ